MKRLLLGLIWFYQKAISPWFPARCRFLPTCSEYAREAVEKYGPARGSLLAAPGQVSALSSAEVHRI